MWHMARRVLGCPSEAPCNKHLCIVAILIERGTSHEQLPGVPSPTMLSLAFDACDRSDHILYALTLSPVRQRGFQRRAEHNAIAATAQSHLPARVQASALQQPQDAHAPSRVPRREQLVHRAFDARKPCLLPTFTAHL